MLTREDYIRQFRKNNPTFTDWTDDDIMDQFVSDYGDQLDQHPALQQYVKDKSRSDTNVLKEFGSAVGAGVDQLQAQLYDTAALTGDLIGSEKMRKWGL